MTAVILACPGEAGGAEINGFLALLLWILFVYLIIKKHVAISCILSTILAFGIRIYKFGMGDMSGVSETITQVICWGVLLFIFYKLFFGNADRDTDKTAYQSRKPQRKKDTSGYYEEDDYSSYYEAEEDSSYERHKDIGPKLKNGSEEYWEYKNAAEAIYRDFCNADNITERRHHKKRGDKLKATLISEYGAKDECVKSIINNFLDLRV
ncbi:hypothetical protein BRYFOR_09092 [Marvinbryantia formatexigens DSM 14469]|uniref:Uncharacterized protein n=1 Tax=Marvinbryantia formatexigens DSM 14469 TaxID=478749 RepID=C6LKA5_9FIRM|nr:hypothetical protein [Marvinbryantia formatexigens]EET58986.1 hypothetical protein BRYFOR_09092 [Marvinbryantia formatexigens DSM 14469]UWO23409.1 hypothetical protein NQ534_13220 [Marvinbryantia formatexigens DSM 14469]SDH26482.1 hypothetical protein SAMN05660368_04129 [Marvinbryantia formatexigens]